MPETAQETAKITRVELIDLQKAEEEFREASLALTAAENRVKPLRLALAEKVLGIKTSAELKALSPDEIEALLEKRLKFGMWESVRGAPRFSFVKTHSGRTTSWKEVFVSLKGEVAAEQIIADTPNSYSYRVEVR